jgi:hypothetical protein
VDVLEEPTRSPRAAFLHRELRPLWIGAALIGGTALLAVGAHRAHGSVPILASLLMALAGLALLGLTVRRFGVFSVGGITWIMVATLFIGRWFFEPVTGSILLTPLASAYYDRDGALIASAVMIMSFALAYVVSSRSLLSRQYERRPAAPRVNSTSVTDLMLIGCLFAAARLLTGMLFSIGIPGKVPDAVPFVGIVYYLSSYGPLVAASLILWYGRGDRRSTAYACGLLLGWALIEGTLGTHGSTFQALLIFGGTKAMMEGLVRVKSVPAVASAVLVCVVVTASLLLAFDARAPLTGGVRRDIRDVPGFVFNRLGGLEYIAPVIGAVDRTGPSMSRLRTSTWDHFMKVEVYGLPSGAVTAFASTAVGWWYGLGGMQGVIVGSLLSGLLAGQFDQWCRRRRAGTSAPAFVLGILLGWATLLLGGTIGSLGGIAIGFCGIAVVMDRAHRVAVRGLARDGEVNSV